MPFYGEGTRICQLDNKGSECWECPSVRRSTSSKNHLAKKSDEHQVLMDRIPLVQDLQAVWLLLFYCAGSRATFWLRSVRPQFTADFADAHDRQMWECFNQLMGIASFSAKAKQYITIPLSLGGVGLSSANRSRDSAHWSSWADSLPMIWNRHPVVATTMILGLNARAIPHFPRCWRVFGHIAERRLHSTKLGVGGPCQG